MRWATAPGETILFRRGDTLEADEVQSLTNLGKLKWLRRRQAFSSIIRYSLVDNGTTSLRLKAELGRSNFWPTIG
jgi:hypothetical protein